MNNTKQTNTSLIKINTKLKLKIKIQIFLLTYDIEFFKEMH